MPYTIYMKQIFDFCFAEVHVHVGLNIVVTTIEEVIDQTPVLVKYGTKRRRKTSKM